MVRIVIVTESAIEETDVNVIEIVTERKDEKEAVRQETAKTETSKKRPLIFFRVSTGP